MPVNNQDLWVKLREGSSHSTGKNPNIHRHQRHIAISPGRTSVDRWTKPHTALPPPCRLHYLRIGKAARARRRDPLQTRRRRTLLTTLPGCKTAMAQEHHAPIMNQRLAVNKRPLLVLPQTSDGLLRTRARSSNNMPPVCGSCLLRPSRRLVRHDSCVRVIGADIRARRAPWVWLRRHQILLLACLIQVDER